MPAVYAVLLLVWSAEIAAPPDIFPTVDLDPEPCFAAATSGRDPGICDRLLGGAGLAADVVAKLLASRARIHQNAGNMDAAEADLTAALNLFPDNGLLVINRGNVRLLQGNTLAALADYDLAIDLTFARDPRAFYNRAFAHRSLGDLNAAIDDFETARILAESRQRQRP